jgi:hypothetical protein
MARRRSSFRGFGCLMLGVMLAAGAALWFSWRHRAAWQHAWRGAPRQSTPDLALARAKSQRAANARFLTVEQLLQLKPRPGASPVRVEAQLSGLQLDHGAVRLQLASLVNPALHVNAEIPGPSANSPLYAELREDVMLRFGQVTGQLRPPAEPTRVVVTGTAVATSTGLELRPVTDLHVE